MSVGIYFSGLYVKIYKIKSWLGQRVGTYVFLRKLLLVLECFIACDLKEGNYIQLINKVMLVFKVKVILINRPNLSWAFSGPMVLWLHVVEHVHILYSRNFVFFQLTCGKA